MMNPHNSYADRITAAKVMLAGLKANIDKLSKWGIDQEFLAEYEQVYNEAASLDNEQEALKARLKEKTAALDQKMEVLDKLGGNSKKIVKMQTAKETWKEFGIADKK